MIIAYLPNIAFKDQTEFASSDNWRNEIKKMHAIWLTVIDVKIILSMFTYGICNADFDLFERTVSNIIPLMFSLDHINCLHLLPVLLHNMKYIPITIAEAFNQLSEGIFTVKDVRQFSQISEQRSP